MTDRAWRDRWLRGHPTVAEAAEPTDAAPPAPSDADAPPAASVAEAAPAPPAAAGAGRMPVPPLLSDLAGWGWRLLVLGVLAYLVLRIAQRLYLVSLPIAAALLVTALLEPVVRALRRRGLSRGLATGTTVVGLLVVIAALITWVVQRALAEVPRLSAELQDAVRKLPISNENLLRMRDQVVGYLQSGSGSFAGGIVTGLQTATEVLTGVVLTLLLAVILLADGDRMWAWIVERLPVAARPRALRAAVPAWARLSGWIRGTVVVATFHATVVGVTLLVLQVPLVAPLVVVVFLGSFIPLVGAVLGGFLATVVTFATQGSTAAIVLVVVLLIDNQVEAHVLQPFLVGRYVRLHPFVVAVVITAGALLGGLAGALLAVPFTAAVYAALTHLPEPEPVHVRGPHLRRRAHPADRPPG